MDKHTHKEIEMEGLLHWGHHRFIIMDKYGDMLILQVIKELPGRQTKDETVDMFILQHF